MAGAIAAVAATTVNETNRYAYGANVGWIDFRGDVNNGARIGEFYCAGYVYSANVGWISLGSGSPANGYAYANTSAADFGLNTDAEGNLRGCAYGANIGWITFERLGGARVNRRTGQLSGWVYSANCGWISLSNALAKVSTDSLWPGPLTADGLPIPWIHYYFGEFRIRAADDSDKDGANNLMEYRAGTDPGDRADVLKIIGIEPAGPAIRLTWNSNPAKDYIIESATAPDGVWSNALAERIIPTSNTTTCEVPAGSGDVRFYRIQAINPF